jgi:hypothetical protein
MTAPKYELGSNAYRAAAAAVAAAAAAGACEIGARDAVGHTANDSSQVLVGLERLCTAAAAAAAAWACEVGARDAVRHGQ